MTNLEALQAMLEYENTNLLAKALTDRGVSSSGTYSTANQRLVELSAADIYLVLLNHPEFREGSKSVNYSGAKLMSLRNEILRKWNALSVTIKAPGTGDTYTNPQAW